MANKFFKCGDCLGNMWPDSAAGRDHIHLDPLERRKRLKLKLRTRNTGWNKQANPRTNPARKQGKSIAPRKRVYGPF